MERAASSDLEALLPHLADLPARFAALLPALAEAQAHNATRVAEVNHRYLARMSALVPGGGMDPAVAYFDFLNALHTLHIEWTDDYLRALAIPDPHGRRVRFLLHQWLEARDPHNFPTTNPDVLQEILRTNGECLQRGQRNYQADLAHGRITMSDPSAHQVGRDLATTPGAVVFENELIQLIRYRPQTAQVRGMPVLLVPPFINKYYILDLSPHNSLVRFLLSQAFQVYMVSWRNIGQAQAGLVWDDYATRGIAAAIDTTLSSSGAARLQAMGFCVGGTLLASTLCASLRDAPVSSLTLLASLLDFTDVGEISSFVDETFVARCESLYADGGVMPGAQLAAAFASLRPRELVWRYVIGNYLLGTTPPAFDLLHWNNDSANLPGKLFTWYVRELYLHNRLRIPGRLQIAGQPADLRQLRMPVYALGTEQDHIVPWRSAYASALLLGGQRTFVLGGSGHIAGVVSPPGLSKRGFRTGDDTQADADNWLSRSTAHAGSWWPHWAQWLAAHDDTDKRRAPRNLGSRRYPLIEAAPGRYVTEIPV